MHSDGDDDDDKNQPMKSDDAADNMQVDSASDDGYVAKSASVRGEGNIDISTYPSNNAHQIPEFVGNHEHPNPQNKTTPNPANAQNSPKPNPMYLHNPIDPITMNGQTATDTAPLYLQNAVNSPSTLNDNSTYLQSTVDPSSTDALNDDVSTNPMYLQNTNTSVHERNLHPDNVEGIRSLVPTCGEDGRDIFTPAIYSDTQRHVSGNPMYMQDTSATHEPNLHANATVHPDNVEEIQSSVPILREDDENNFTPAYDGDAQEEDGTTDIAATRDGHPSIQPYAVRFQDNNDDALLKATDVAAESQAIQPYAVAYMCQEDVGEETASQEREANASDSNNGVLTTSGTDANPPGGALSTEDPTRAQNALIPNPMYVANVRHRPAVGCTTRWVYVAAMTAAILLISIGISVDFSLRSIISVRKPKSTEDPMSTVTGYHDYFSTPESTTAGPVFVSTTGSASRDPVGELMITISSQLEEISRHEKQEKIVFGEEGRGPGQFRQNYGVAVSADNEIFVADMLNRRVQVFSMDGVYLRQFSTEVPGESTEILPTDIAIDAKGFLWAVGNRGALSNPNAHVIRYSSQGRAVVKSDLRLQSAILGYPSIEVDVLNDRIIVGEGNKITIFQPDGSLVRSFEDGNLKINDVASALDGNILVTAMFYPVQVYNHSGNKLFEVGNRLSFPLGICTDSSGHMIVSNDGKDRIDMYTSQGEFVRVVVDFKDPRKLAVGSEGQLVVTNIKDHSVTIFPRHTVSP
uniref:SMP-30/Gluconolactonase/LRE-like region domain-containing protein n=1 Tax=Branchiostoma floridae TaxID=7739 RepID=C3Z022_BRAFL|eukprot:XP_002598069.1 hypothetical protein BRAFLDRAFT_85715 [Branchiostoma floridae]